MKIRDGFVTNSSSSSYVCDICLRSEGGYDLELSEINMKECEYGHTFCDDHVDFSDDTYLNGVLTYLYYHGKDESLRIKAGSLLPMSSKNRGRIVNFITNHLDTEKEYNLDSALCPICNKSFVPDKDVVNYLSKKFDLNVLEIKEEIRKEFRK